MGVDFLKRTAPSFHRALDREAVALRTPSLLTSNVPVLSRTVCADITASMPAPGEVVLLRLIKDEVMVQRDNRVIGRVSAPPQDFIERMRRGAAVEAAAVKTARPLSCQVELAIEAN